ncbi:MAG: family 16 glycoside hydrolase, partial [Gemmataceae bacterium]
GLWPKEYHGKLFMGNLHGHRINVDVITPHHSSYVGDRNPDFLLTHDRHCIIVGLHTGPDGNVYFSDWSDQQVCHQSNPAVWDRTNGRLYQIRAKNTPRWKPIDLQKATDSELMNYQSHENAWFARHARRILQERTASRQMDPVGGLVRGMLGDTASQLAMARLRQMSVNDTDPARRLRALWTLHSMGALEAEQFVALGRDTDPHVRGWSAMLGADGAISLSEISVNLSKLVLDPSPIVRRFVISTLLRFPDSPARAELVRTLLTKSVVPADDTMLAALTWYLAESHLAAHPDEFATLAPTVSVPNFLKNAARRLAAIGTTAGFEAALAPSLQLPPEGQLAIFDGILMETRGQKKLPQPGPNWTLVHTALSQSEQAPVRNAILQLGLRFGDRSAIDTFRERAEDAKRPLAERQMALLTLAEVRDPQLVKTYLKLLTEPGLGNAALRALAASSDPSVPPAIVTNYSKFSTSEKREALSLLSARVEFARVMVAAIGTKAIPPTDVPAETIRQLRNLNDGELNTEIAKVWGVVRESSAERKQLMAQWATKLKSPVGTPDLAQGRAIFQKVCAQCHVLFGVGGKVGPEITGANRADVNYMLENIFDPAAVIPKEYAATQLQLADGRVLTGIIKERTAQKLTLQTATEVLVIPAEDVEKTTQSEESMMPADLTKQLSATEFQHLIAYLQSPKQTTMLATAENIGDFFNGKDLAGWTGDTTVFKVDNGEIVGSSTTGLKRNAFLVSQLELRDFKLTLEMKLVPDTENSGIQFRSLPLSDGEMRGPQADAGKGWWGKLYEESARGILWEKPADQHVKVGDWNRYEIEAIGPRVRTWLNGELCVDLTDEKLARSGQIGLQVHSGKAIEVRWRKLKITLPEK